MWTIFKVFIEFATTLLPFSVLVSWPKAYVILVPGESESRSVVSDSLWPHGLSPWNSPGQNTGVGGLSPLQGIFPTQGSNPGLPHCGQILYQLSHKGSPRILEWVAYPFSRGSSWPRNQTGLSCVAARFFTDWAMRETHLFILNKPTPHLTVVRIPACLHSGWSPVLAVQLLSLVRLFVTPWTAAHQASLPFTISQSLLKLMPIESAMPSNHLILFHALLLLPWIFPSVRVFSNELAFCIRWPKNWSFSFSINPSNEYSGLISFRIDWFDPLAVQGALKSPLQTTI